MKIMKIKNLTILFCLLLLTSCVVKSLHPFYTNETISFDESFIGNWKDSKNGIWKVISFKDEIMKENPIKKMKKEDLILSEKYSASYYIERLYKGITAVYLVTPFKINNQKFLDFLPLEYQGGNDNLLEIHTIYTHSLVKYDVQKNGEIEIRWLDEDKIEDLFKENKIKIKHEIIGALDRTYLLTANSKELQKFVKKYMNSNDDGKWETSIKFTLSKINGTD
ncbi:MAG: hypothetical protein ACI9JT_001222 [Polaribacter sp.]|jgi:hypothetical protein